jgi:hypothetical protein
VSGFVCSNLPHDSGLLGSKKSWMIPRAPQTSQAA